MRMSHYIPDRWKGEYQVVAQRTMDRNAEVLRIRNAKGDAIYDNKDETFYLDDESG